MPVRLISGSFRVLGAATAGDRLRFYPDRPDAFAAAGFAVRTNSRGGAVVRLDGVDALEGRYLPPGGQAAWHQAGDLAAAASAALLTALGFRRVEYDDDGMVVASVPEQVSGYVLGRCADRHGRLVGFAFPGRRRGRAADGSAVPLDAKGLQGSVNWVLLRQGLGYPAFYSRLHPQLRAELAAAAEHASGLDRGVWRRDVSRTGLRLAGREQVRSGIVLYPKLFRRLADYLELEGYADGFSLSGFPAYLQLRADELCILPDGLVTQLDGVLEVRRNVLRLAVPVHQIVFREA